MTWTNQVFQMNVKRWKYAAIRLCERRIFREDYCTPASARSGPFSDESASLFAEIDIESDIK